MYEIYQNCRKHNLNGLSSQSFNSLLFHSHAVLPLSRVALFKRFVFPFSRRARPNGRDSPHSPELQADVAILDVADSVP